MNIPFVGMEYTSRSLNENSQVLLNLFPELDKTGKYPVALYGTPGLSLLGTIGSGPIRGMWTAGSFLYVVSGTELYKVTTAYSGTLLGTVSGTGSVSMKANVTQLIIVNGTTGYIVTLATDTFAEITDADFPANPVTVDYLDGYFLVNDLNTQAFYYSTNGLVWAALDFASAEGNPDNIVAIFVDHRDLLLFGEQTTESWYSSGVAATPFQRRDGAFMETGCGAAFSIAKLDNSVVWLGKDDKGTGMVWKAAGYTPQRISTHAVEFAIQNYATISDAIGYTYQQEGHSFYVLTFPTAGKTWVYDASTNAWHQRGYWQQAAGTFTRHRSNCFAVFNNQLVVGDYANGKLYEFDLDTYTDNGDILRRVRACQVIYDKNTLNRIPHGELQVDMEAGVGLITGQGSDPQAMLRWSDDGGHTWSNYHSRTIGAIGAYATRVIWRRLGLAFQRVYELSITDPVKVVILGAVLK